MNKKCARCEKTVYPIEELKCLDKVSKKIVFQFYFSIDLPYYPTSLLFCL